MIAHIRGVVTEKFGNFLILDVNGVGYEVMVPTPDFEAALLDEERKYFSFRICNPKDMFYLRLHIPKLQISILHLPYIILIHTILSNRCSIL